eukprot:TRINITY_DN3992_c0_g1_i1.p1 TRINITY_DN3992_c0_g1~~TRINITY_DN3992_c0_g1_i1.p1  ORF type:complete len:458 (+),score=101.03 TRINITY_DN3992_c0_g1_i1:65-1438(+)
MVYLSTILMSFLICGTIIGSILYTIRSFHEKRRRHNAVAFFHPYCNDGGGGERVLWAAVAAVQKHDPRAQVIIYTGADAKPADILKNVKNHFGIDLPKNPQFVLLHRRNLIEASRWPRFTMLGQSLGSILLGWEALSEFTPRVFIDTMGYAFTYPLFKWLGGCRVGCYTHYPTISTDMLQRVTERRPTFNNNAQITSSVTLSLSKSIYYRVFAWLYGMVGSLSETVMVNSNWTKEHINSLWRIPARTNVVFPPCDTTSLQRLKLDGREPIIVSIGQFRPEKDHPLQIASLHEFLTRHPKRSDTKLVLIGSVRHAGDQERVDQLKAQVSQLKLEDNVIFALNISHAEKLKWLEKAMIGVHTMWNEHFGIGVVEFMAAGVITVAHNSGGPRSDIIKPLRDDPVGFLASTPAEYAEAFNRIFEMKESERKELQNRARKSADRFSDEAFERDFQKFVARIL